MSGLSSRDCAGLMDLVAEWTRLGPTRLLPRHLLQRLMGLIPSEIGGFHQGHLRSHRVVPHYEPEIPQVPVITEEFWEIEKCHPLASRLRTRPNRAWKPSDVVSQAAFEKTDFYNVLYRPLGIHYEMIAMIPVENENQSVRVLALHRERRDFSERDRTLLNLMLPHLSKLLRKEAGVPGWLDTLSTEAFGERIRDRTDWDLTLREMEVLFWIGQGKSNAEIGKILGISPRTAETHALRVYPKLGVENRYAAIVQLERLL